MNKNLKILITAMAIIVVGIFGVTQIQWQFEKDWTTLSRDGEVIALSKWTLEAERSYINMNSWYRTNVMCPKIIDAGGYKTKTRCYYAPDTYEPLSRNLLNTEITVDEFYDESWVTKVTPHYKYGTRGAYAGKVTEEMLFTDTEKEEEFPQLYYITWKPTDTRNYKLVWRLEKLKHNYPDGLYNACDYTFGHVKVDLLSECKNLNRVKIWDDKAYFYFNSMRGQQELNVEFVDPPLIQSVASTQKWRISNISDTELFYDVESVSYDGNKFSLNLKAVDEIKSISNKAIELPDGKPITLSPKEIEKENKSEEKGHPTEVSKNETVKTIEELKTKLHIASKDYELDNSIKTIDFFEEYNRTTGLMNYSFKLSADYITKESVEVCDENGQHCVIELVEVKHTRDEVILKLGGKSIYVTAVIDTDLKIVQTGLSNTTDYTASVDVSEAKLFMGEVDSDYDLTSGLVGWWSFDNNNTYDFSGYNNHGTNYGATYNATGKLGGAMEFDGSVDHITSGTTGMNVNNGTIIFWANAKALGGITANHLISHRTAGVDNRIYISRTTSTGNIALSFANMFDENTHIQMVLGTWYSFALTWNGGDYTFYCNGIENKTDSVSTLSSISDSIVFGRYVLQNYEFEGTIDDVRIYDRALSPTEIEAYYNISSPDYETKVVELSSSPITYDVISNTNTSVVVNIPEISEDFMFTPTYIRCNMSSSSNYTCFNTTDNSWFNQESVSITENYLGENNLTRVRINNPFAVGIYDLYLLNLTEYLTWSPNDLRGIWYDSYTGSSDNSTLKATTDYSQWVDTCNAGNTTGMVGCWNFNELYGTSAHDRANNSANNNDGTLTNMNTGVDNASSGWTREGKYGNALMFDGVDDYVATPSITGLTEWTISLWVNSSPNYHDSLTARQSLMGNSLNGNDDFWGFTNDTHRLILEFEDGTNYQSINNLMRFNEWIHIIMTYNTTHILYYTNGVYRDSDSVAGKTSNMNRIGAGYSNNVFNGTIDEVKIYNRALDQSEITAEYNRGRERLDSITRQEGIISAGVNQDYLLTNGTVNITEAPEGSIWIKPLVNLTSSLWMIDFGLNGSNVSAYDNNTCGNITTVATASVNAFRKGSYALSYSAEKSHMGSSEKKRFHIHDFPRRPYANTNRIFFQIENNLTENTVSQIDINITEVKERTGITTDINTSTYRLYRVNRWGYTYNDTGICYEQPVNAG